MHSVQLGMLTNRWLAAYRCSRLDCLLSEANCALAFLHRVGGPHTRRENARVVLGCSWHDGSHVQRAMSYARRAVRLVLFPLIAPAEPFRSGVRLSYDVLDLSVGGWLGSRRTGLAAVRPGKIEAP